MENKFMVTKVGTIQPLAWEPPYTTGAAQKRQKKKKNSGFSYTKGGGSKAKFFLVLVSLLRG